SELRLAFMYNTLFGGTFAVIYCAITTLALYLRKKNEPEYTPFYMLGMVITAEMVIPPAFQYSIMKAGEDILSFSSNFVDYARRFQEEFVHPAEIARQKIRKNDKDGIFMASLFYISLTNCGLMGVIVLLNPKIPFVPGCHFEFHHWALQWAFQVYQAYWVTNHLLAWLSNLFIYAFQGIEYSFGILYMLREMKLERNRYTTFEKLRTPDVFIRNYRMLEILHAKAMSMYSGTVLPVHQWCSLTTATYCIYCSLKMKGIIAVVSMVGAFITLYWLFVAFTIFATIHSESKAVLNSWTIQKHDLGLQKTLKTLRPIKIHVGDYSFCDHSMVVTMFKSICEGTVDLLIVKVVART
ncbi:unnamed protein product, partial [Allacma fusca]